MSISARFPLDKETERGERERERESFRVGHSRFGSWHRPTPSLTIQYEQFYIFTL